MDVTDAADPVDIDVDDDALDEVSRRDLDFEAHPLPRLAPAVVAWWGLHVVVIAGSVGLLALLALWRPHAVFAVPLGLWALLWPMALVVFRPGQGMESEQGLLRLDRQAHPRFFAVVDDICARLGTTTPRAFFLVNSSNAYNARVQSDSTVMLGFASLVASDITAMRSTLGHELGHHLAEDTTDTALIAWGQLDTLGNLRIAPFPFAPLAQWLATRTKADAMRRSRLNEHAADFWGGLAAGRETTMACLQQDRRAQLLFAAVTDDVIVLREGGGRVFDLYRCLRLACRDADDHGFEILAPTGLTDPHATHPADRVRGRIVEHRLEGLPGLPDPNAGAAAGASLFDDDDAIGRDLSALFYDPEETGAGDWLEVVDDDFLWVAYAAALPAQLRGAFAAAGHPRLAVPMSSEALFAEVRFLIESGVRFCVSLYEPTLPAVLMPSVVVPDPRAEHFDVTHRIVGLLLDLLVNDGVLEGSRTFGTIRVIAVDGEYLFRLGLAARLSRGEGWDDLASEITRQGEAQRQRFELVLRGFHFQPFTPGATSTLATEGTGWERDTEEIVLPPAHADNSDRERCSDEQTLNDEAPAAE
jgi:hypothetical protein